MLIYACISSHGYGHAARSAAVLVELAALRPHWRLVLSTAVAESFLTLAMGKVPFERRPCPWDVGVIQADALGADPAATLEGLERLERELPQRLAQEAAWMRAQNVPLLVLADVPPAAALLAERVGAPLVWLASFGWEAIYGPMGPAFTPWAERCLELYRRGGLLLACPLAMPMHWGVPVVPLGLTSSRPRLELASLAQELRLPSERSSVVMVSFGGLGLDLEPGLLSLWPDHVFISPEAGVARAPNGRILPTAVRPLDLLPLVGRWISKPGYSTFCEALSQQVGLHLVHREGFAEAPVLERALQRHGWHRLLSQEQFRCGEWQLDQPLLPPQEGPLASDGAAEAARALVGVMEG